jgi:hypothetical protein
VALAVATMMLATATMTVTATMAVTAAAHALVLTVSHDSPVADPLVAAAHRRLAPHMLLISYYRLLPFPRFAASISTSI